MGKILKCDYSSAVLYCLLCCADGSNFCMSVDEIPKCDYSNESY